MKMIKYLHVDVVFTCRFEVGMLGTVYQNLWAPLIKSLSEMVQCV